MILFISNKGQGFIIVHLLTSLVFALLYWLSDQLLFSRPRLSKKLGLGRIKDRQTLSYYIYYALITQSTVGYEGGKGEGGFQQVESHIFKLLNISQLISIFVITGYFF